MAYKPILFSTPMVQSILGGSKTMTRRVVKKKYGNTDLKMRTDKYGTRLIERQNDAPPPEPITYPDGRKGTRWHMVAIRDVPSPYQRGDILWVRETWQQLALWTDNGCELDWDKMQYYYAADGNPGIEMTDDNGFPLERFRWRPSIHMPKAAARIFLRVTDVRAERVQDIDNSDAIREGATGLVCTHCNSTPYDCTDCMNTGWIEPPILDFQEIWNSTIKPKDRDKYGWDANPWVWVYTFERVDKPEGWPKCV